MYIKTKLGKNTIINWVNFLDFMKKESERSINRLNNPNSDEINLNEIKEDDKDSIFQNQSELLLGMENDTNGKNDDNNNYDFKIFENNFKCLYNIISNKTGISNISNSCFINAALQIILHNHNFMSKFLKKLNTIKEKKK